MEKIAFTHSLINVVRNQSKLNVENMREKLESWEKMKNDEIASRDQNRPKFKKKFLHGQIKTILRIFMLNFSNENVVFYML